MTTGIVLSVVLPRRAGAWFGSGLVGAGAVGVFAPLYRVKIAERGRAIAYATFGAAALVPLLLLALRSAIPAHQPAPTVPQAAVGAVAWAIPERIVICESGGVNLPPNRAGAAGYYQITPATWAAAGGPAPDDASQHSKAEQDAVAGKLWAGGEGAALWVCR
jgi:hypothetical protein